MPLLTELYRYKLRRSRQTMKLGRSLSSSDIERIITTVVAILSDSGGNKVWQTAFLKALSGWLHNTTSHGETTQRVTELSYERKALPEQAFLVSQICATFGLFESSLAFEHAALKSYPQSGTWLFGIRKLLELLALSVHLGDLEMASHYSSRVVATNRELSRLPFSAIDLLHYVQVWKGDVLFRDKNFLSYLNQQWSSYASGRSFLIIGPGQIPAFTPAPSESELVVRIAGPGSYSWKFTKDIASGRTNVVYLIPETLESIGQTPAERVQKLGDFDFICISRGEATYLRNSRKVEAASRLFLRGHPNMVPLAVIDLLRLRGTNIRVIGSDFFASSSSYRADSIRTTPDGRAQTNQGSTGNRYDRSTLMASHNAFQNRRLIKNLLDSGRVTGDDAFLEACSLSDLDYARRLDLHYGQHRL